MSRERPAREIEPVFPTASRSLTLPGPKARSEPKSIRTVSRTSFMSHPAPRHGRTLARSWAEERLLTRPLRPTLSRRGRKCGEQAGETRCAQRHVTLTHQPAGPLHGNGGFMADAINREHHNVGAAD